MELLVPSATQHGVWFHLHRYLRAFHVRDPGQWYYYKV